MNDKLFAFIICTNNQVYLNECIHYINQLDVPQGYSTELLTITDAPCMTAGYNEGMHSSSAKYKIYMHQDTFILNRFFLRDILEIFSEDSSIGMIGLVGYPSVAPTGIMWHEVRVGATPLYGAKRSYPEANYNLYRYCLTDGYTDVALIDGLMMITSTDLPWDEKHLKHCDFYDAFQSMNFLLNGYRFVVPIQTLPWFVHDDGRILSMWNYHPYRKLFLELYAPYIGKNCTEIRKEAKNEHPII